MAISLKHGTLAVGVDAENGEIRKDQWNEDHALTMATDRILGRTTAGAGAVEEISVGTGLTLSAGSLTAANKGAWVEVSRAVASSDAEIIFTGIDGTSEEWMICCLDVLLSSNNGLEMRTSSDGGATYATASGDYPYSYSQIGAASAGRNLTAATSVYLGYNDVGGANGPISPKVHIMNPATNPTILDVLLSEPWGNSYERYLYGLLRTINAVRFYMGDGGTITSGTFVLLKRSK